MRNLIVGACAGVLVGLYAGDAVAQLPFRSYLFNGTELFDLFLLAR